MGKCAAKSHTGRSPVLPGGSSKPGAPLRAQPARVPPGEIIAVEHIRRMRGGSQAHLLRCSDGHYYVVKFPNNPQGARTLACNFLGTLLAIHLDLPVQAPQIIQVPEALIRNTSELVIESASGNTPCAAGKCFGS